MTATLGIREGSYVPVIFKFHLFSMLVARFQGAGKNESVKQQLVGFNGRHQPDLFFFINWFMIHFHKIIIRIKMLILSSRQKTFEI